MADSEENYLQDLGVKGLRNTLQWQISIINSFDKAKLSCNTHPTNKATLFLTPFL